MFALAWLAACDEDPTPTDPRPAEDSAPAPDTEEPPSDTGGGPLIDSVALRFVPRFGAEPLGCGSVYDAAAFGSATVEVYDLRMYVSEVALLDAETGAEVPVTLTDDALWQGQGVALLDFEDGTGGCAATGNPGLNDLVVGEVPPGRYDGIAFTLGVPFALNHQDVAMAPAPLNVPAMYWIWQSGYKFARIDMVNDNAAPANLWVLHLGSTGCAAGSYYEAPSVECDQPNRPRVVLSAFDPATDVVVFDLAALLQGADIGVDTEFTAPGCMSADANECPPLFANLGLDYATGQCVDDCAGQTAFVVE